LLEPILGESVALTDWLRSVRYRATFTVAATTGTRLPREAFGVLPHNDGRVPVSALAVHGAKADPSGQPEGDVVLAWPTPDAADRLASRAAAEIAAEMVPAIEMLIPAARGQVGHVRVYRHEPGTPVPSPGFAADRARGRALARDIGPPIALAGDYLTMPLLEGAVASGDAAAHWLERRLT
jgi:protoporphyrinogen oxidase